MWSATDAATRRIFVKRITINGDKPALAQLPIEQLKPQSEPSAVRYPHRIVLAIAGKRYEFTLHTEVREITTGPAKLIEMPGRSSSKR
jgi:hypothetical protein